MQDFSVKIITNLRKEEDQKLHLLYSIYNKHANKSNNTLQNTQEGKSP